MIGLIKDGGSEAECCIWYQGDRLSCDSHMSYFSPFLIQVRSIISDHLLERYSQCIQVFSEVSLFALETNLSTQVLK